MTSETNLAIEASGLSKAFGDTKAVDGVDLAVRRGSVYGLIGPNGAGKTTLTKVIATLVQPTSGTVTVNGFDSVRDDAPLDRRQLVDHRPDGREVGVARVRRWRAHGDVDEVGAVHRLGDVGREAQSCGVALEQLVEAGLVDRHLAAAQRFDPVGEDVADNDVVAELAEAGAGDEADVAGAEDSDVRHGAGL